MYRALLVEDDSEWKELLAEMLEDMQFVLRHAPNYEGALKALKDGPYDLALLDVSLVAADHENRDGLRVLEQLRTFYPHTPAIILTGYATVDLAVEALTQLNANDFLRKDQFDLLHFRKKIQRVLGSATQNIISAPTAIPPTSSQPIAEPLTARILVVEDNSGWQSIYEELLDEIGAQMKLAVSYGQARGLLRRDHFDAAVVDLNLVSSTKPNTNLDGFHLLRLTQSMQLPTIVISALGELSTIDRAYEEHQIFAFFDKEGFQRRTFQQTLRDAVTQHTAPDPHPSAFLPIENSPLANLTPRQREVLNLLARGMTNNEIAKELIVTVNTVKKHVLGIFATLGVNTRAAAAAMAARYGLGSK